MIWGILMILVFAYTAYKFLLKKDYLLYAQVSCNPVTESCFVYECDPEVEECEEDTSYFKVIYKKAYLAPTCDNEDTECPELSCEIGEENCDVVYCSEEDLEDYGASMCVGL